MSGKFFITDENNLDNSKDIQIKQQNKDSSETINKDSQQKIFNDFSGTIDMSHKHLVIYNLLTVSDKEINNRLYPDKHVQAMMSQKQLNTFYMKPILKNHDSDVDALGRFVDGNYVRHSDMQMFFGDEIVPQVVIDEFKKRGAFQEGTGSNIGKAISNNLDFKAKIIDGTFLSTSQGAISESLTCNICGHSYFSMECTHMRGRNYPVMSNDGNTVLGYKKCIPETGELSFIESSTVNVPANNTSTLMVYDTIKNQIVTMDNIQEYSSIFDIKNIQVQSNDSLDKPVIIINNKTNGLTDEELLNQTNKNNSETKEVAMGVTDKNENAKKLDDAKDKVEEIQTLSNPFKDSALEIFIDKANEKFGIDDAKSEEFFNKLDDSEIGVALKVLRFVDKNKKVEVTTQVEANNDKTENKEVSNDNTVQENSGDNTDKTNAVNDNKNEELLVQINALKDEIAKLKGINNEIPNTDIKDKKENEDNKKHSGFDF